MAKLKVLKNVNVEYEKRNKILYVAGDIEYLVNGAVYIAGDIVYPDMQEAIALFKNYPDSFEPLDKEAKTAVQYLENNQ